MPRKKAKKKRKFNATSIPMLAPRTLKKSGAKQRKKTTRQARKDNPPWQMALDWNISHYTATLLILASFAAAIFLFTDPSFRATAPQVNGNDYVESELIRQQAHLAGRNIYLIDPAKAANKIETFLPQVEHAKVRLGLPNQILIQVTERTPVLSYRHSGENLWADSNGHLFPATTEITTIPILIDEDGYASTDGKNLNPGIWPAIKDISTNIPEINEFHYRNVYGLFFISPEGWNVYLGDGSNMTEKLSAWQNIRQRLLQENRTIKAIDLRYDRVYIE